MVGFGATTFNQLIANSLRKGNVPQAVAMYVADFHVFLGSILYLQAIRVGCDPGPPLQSGIDSFFRSRDSHSLLARDHQLDMNCRIGVTNSGNLVRRCAGRI